MFNYRKAIFLVLIYRLKMKLKREITIIFVHMFFKLCQFNYLLQIVNKTIKKKKKWKL